MLFISAIARMVMKMLLHFLFKLGGIEVKVYAPVVLFIRATACMVVKMLCIFCLNLMDV